jgi:hypothetical protein
MPYYLRDSETISKTKPPIEYLKKYRLPSCRLSFLLNFLTLEDGTDTLSRNVGKGLPFDAA